MKLKNGKIFGGLQPNNDGGYHRGNYSDVKHKAEAFLRSRGALYEEQAAYGHRNFAFGRKEAK